MIDTDTWKIQASYKHGTRDQHMLNVRGADAKDLLDQLDGLMEHQILDMVVSTGQLLQAIDAAAGITQQPEQQQQYQTPLQSLQQSAAAPPPQQAAAASTAPRCVHGEKRFKRGVGAKGPWAAWMCPAMRDDPTRCAPSWVKD